MFGFSRYSPFVSRYFLEANIKSSVYMCFVIFVLEIWMMIYIGIYAYKKALAGEPKTRAWLVDKYSMYVSLTLAALVVLLYAIYYFRSKKPKSLIVGNAILLAFTAICLVFGIHISWPEYQQGMQILCFVTMLIFGMLLLVWRPWFSLSVIILFMGAFYYLMKYQSPGVEMVQSTWVNFLTLYISVSLVSFSIYQQRYAEATARDDLERSNVHLKYIADHDEVTGIHNLWWFLNEAKKLADNEPDVIRKFLYIDIFNFKTYNESEGFSKGTVLLAKIAEKLEEIFDGEPVARFSDDHFIVYTKRQSIRNECDALQEFLDAESGGIMLGYKIGAYAEKKTGHIESARALDRARYACNTIKKQFGINYVEFDEDMSAQYHLNEYIISHIDEAVEKEWIKVRYQPVVWADDYSLCGAEALARWDDPKYGLMSPASFVPVLEEYRLIHKLDMCIAKIVFRDIKESLDKGQTAIPVSLNFSRLDFEMLDVSAYLDELYENSGLPRKYVHVEITESALNDESGLLKESITDLAMKGYPIWLDDFGSGYSSLNTLKDYQFDVIKVDMMFLRGFETNPKNRMILSAIFNMTKELEFDTLCEGVETEEQAEFLRSVGCKRLQGYYFSKPVSLDELKARIENGELVLSDKLDYA